jgi:hypothetical protein
VNLLKNVFFTALMVIGTTMATTVVAVIVVMVMATREAATAVDANLLLYGGFAAMIMAALLGFFFSFATLFVAALTMPPAAGLMRIFKLPRPLFDIFGGAAAALICAAMAAAVLESVARAKGGGLGAGGDDIRLVLDICAMFAGAVLGYLRHAVLVRPKHEEPAAPQLAY